MAVVNIIDTSQLIEDPYVIKYLVDKGQKLTIPRSVQSELNKKLNEWILDDQKLMQVIWAKKIIQLYKSHITFAQTAENNGFGDAAIQQLIVAKLGESSVSAINVYTFDANLALDCLNYNQSRSIQHGSIVKTFRYKNNKEELFQPVPKNKEKPVQPVPKYPKIIIAPEAIAWMRDGSQGNFNRNDNLAEEIAPCETPSGSKTVLKYWAWYAKQGESYRIYKNIKLYKGNKVHVNLITMDNSCDVYAGLLAYNSANGSEEKSETYLPLETGKWVTLVLDIDSDYDFINIELLPGRDAQFNGYWEGMDGFIDGFQITN